ncbi:DNA polymerase III subunit gamma and tau [Actinotalea subterranea]|uniref:DNA polymerase III subunit gamma and tau n=1 Tax=Actinotalea subterranea TaxID=2607497 RepID=UPI0011EC0923|nr:DNA polymerase III subunit gamma and tau [Actinotalea subterranea]
MTTALYRRYRPESFAEVIGQEHVTEPLMQALRADRVTHAYLFSGPRGCGKTTSARILARCLNCAQGPTPEPCGTCESCVELGRGGPGSLDVVEIDAASHGGVDDARDLRERATFAPARDRYKIFILDEAHMVTSQGFNALLKIVEEPPPHIKFIFATTEPDKVIGTIRSRTHHYPFRLVGPATLQPYLEQLCTAEGVAVGAGVLPLVVRAGGGSVRDSLSVLDQLVAGADASGIDYERAVALLGYTHATLLDDVVDAIAARDGASAFRVVDRVVSSGHEPRRFVEDVLERLRDLIVIAASGDAAQAVLRDLPADQLERMRGQAAVLGASELSRSADLVNAALSEMTGATSPRLHLELLVARLLLPAADDTVNGLGARLDRVERELGGSGVARVAAAPALAAAAPAVAPAVEVTPATARAAVEAPARAATPAPARAAADASEPVRASAQTAPVPDLPEPALPEPALAEATAPSATEPSDVEAAVEPAEAAPAVHAPAAVEPSTQAQAGGPDAETVRRRWPEVLQTLRGLRMATWVLVSQNAQVAQVAAGKVTLAFTTPQLATTFRTGPHPENVQRALHETLGLDVRIETALAESASQARPTGMPEPEVGSGAQDRPTPLGGISTSQAEASWGAPAAAPRTTQAGGSPAAGQNGPGSGPGAAPAGGAAAGGQGPSAAALSSPPRADAARDPSASRTAGGRDASSAASDGVPDGPEPEPEPDAHEAPTAGSRPGGAPRGARPWETARPVAAPSPQDRRAVEEGEDASPDDPDLAGSGLVGAPLVAQMLGGTVIDEIPDEIG